MGHENLDAEYLTDNARFLRSSHPLKTPGQHTLKIAMVDPGIVVQKIIISDHRLPESYFGPPDCSSVR